MSFDSTHIHTDVTAVSIHPSNDLILAGIGSSMYVYKTESSKLLQRLNCLHGQKIYGFKCRDVQPCSVIVFGGKQFTILTCNSDGPVLFTKLFVPITCGDWLHSAVWTTEEHDLVSVLTAHNVVQTYNITKQHLVSSHASKDNSILYSGLLLGLANEVLVMAGTVYSEVIIHISGEDEPLHRLKGHKGVIFSIACLPDKNIIVTTSDDRSVRIWGPKNVPQDLWSCIEYWRHEIVCKHELYGHSARVMRSSVTREHIVSVGEDSHLCIWTHGGDIVKKVKRHQIAGIWSIDAKYDRIVTGGGDGAVITQSVSALTNNPRSDILRLDCKPKYVAYSATNNLFILSESNTLFYYDFKKMYNTILTLDPEVKTSYHCMSLSPCRKICALAGRRTFIQVVIETESLEFIFLTVQLKDMTILSLHWAGAYLVVCSENGVITVFTVTASAVDIYTVFELPNCKERWLTSASVDDTITMFIIGDRCGGVHLFKRGVNTPLNSISKVHGRYGPTSITINGDLVTTTGRDKHVRYYKMHEDKLEAIATRELHFHWVEKVLDTDNGIVCGFKEKMFVVHSLIANENLLEIPCGGGHRSWDVLYYKSIHDVKKMIFKLAYIKNSNTEILTISKDTTFSLRKGSHSKEINCLKSHKVGDRTIFISGGEDTTLRITLQQNDMSIEDLVVYKNLSSVKTVKTYARDCNELLLMSGGGRAQIGVRLIQFITRDEKIQVITHDIVDYMLKGTDKERKGETNWRNVTVDSEPEQRVMDLDYIVEDNSFTIFAGCSDARIAVFDLNIDEKSLKLIKESNYLSACILKTVCIKIANNDVLVTCSTRGEVAFWDAANINEGPFEPSFITTTNKSGINSIACRNLSDGTILIITGGDDNALHLNVLKLNDQLRLSSLQVMRSLVIDKHHSSAITGICLIGEFILSSSVDQRMTLYKWNVSDNIECDFVYQMFSDVADIKGIDWISQKSSSLSVCVFGKGIEVFTLPTDT